MTKKGGDPSALPQDDRGRGHSFALLRVRVTDKKKGTSKKKGWQKSHSERQRRISSFFHQTGFFIR